MGVFPMVLTGKATVHRCSPRSPPPFRTSTGRGWHVATPGEPWTFLDGTQAFGLRLTPPLAAIPDTAEVVITGPATRVRVAIPVRPAPPVDASAVIAWIRPLCGRLTTSQCQPHLGGKGLPCLVSEGEAGAVRVLAIADRDQASGVAYLDTIAAAVPRIT